MPAMAVVDAAHAKPSIAIHWIRNCILSATVALAASFLISGARYATGADAADAGFGAALAFYVAVACLAAFTGVANGRSHRRRASAGRSVSARQDLDRAAGCCDRRSHTGH